MQKSETGLLVQTVFACKDASTICMQIGAIRKLLCYLVVIDIQKNLDLSEERNMYFSSLCKPFIVISLLVGIIAYIFWLSFRPLS